MPDKPFKEGPEALSELSNLSSDLRLHILGLFEQFAEGLIILLVQVVTIVALMLRSPTFAGDTSSLGLLAFAIYLGFSILWVARPLNGISRTIRQSFSRDELQKCKVYDRYCEGGWFARTIGGLVLASVLFGVVVWFLL